MNRGGYFYDLHILLLEDLGQKIKEDLANSFDEVTCAVVECPDLSNAPFGLNTKGICGNVMVADVGSVDYLLPHPRLDKIYDIADIAAVYNKTEAFICGAGAGPFHKINSNCEMVPCVKFNNGKIQSNDTLLAVLKNNENCTFKTDLSEFGILGQFHCSEGKQGTVLKVTLNKRIKEGSILTFIRESLAKHYCDKDVPVYISGVMIMESGSAKIHVMSDFVDEPLDSEDKINNWLHFFHVPAPFIGFLVMASHDPLGLGLRLEHCHGFTSDRSVAGHFHGDVSAEVVKYTLYLVVAERCFRQDRN